MSVVSRVSSLLVVGAGSAGSDLKKSACVASPYEFFDDSMVYSSVGAAATFGSDAEGLTIRFYAVISFKFNILEPILIFALGSTTFTMFVVLLYFHGVSYCTVSR